VGYIKIKHSITTGKMRKIMEKLNFSRSIDAPREKVWQVLWDDSSYREWTSVFSNGSYAETEDWAEGSTVRFLDSSGQGMVSTVVANNPFKFMSFRHLGMVKDGVEDTDSDQVKAWAGAMENYTLDQSNGTTNLVIDIDITPEYKEYFDRTWPQALDKIKTLSEQ
jgi:hypothetical protein